MFEIPLGKAITPLETEVITCDDCCLWNNYGRYKKCSASVACCIGERKDGKNVIYKLVDYPAKENKQ